MIITIDGPTASGKSTVGRQLAKELGYYYLYTGLLYRALAHILMKHHGYTLDTIAQPDMKLCNHILDSNRFVYRYDAQDRERIFFDGVDITPFLKGDTIGQTASIISTNPAVRRALNALQRSIADDHDIVIDGRDSGSVVFAHADFKFFLTAAQDERTRRWQEQQKKRGKSVSFAEAAQFISTRDTRDSTRKEAPLTIAKGAIEIDSTDLPIDQVVQFIKQTVQS